MIEPTQQHSSHNQRWQLLDTSSQIPVCLACVIEIVEDSTIVLLKKKPGIVTFLRLLTSNGEGVIESMNHDPRVAAHFTMAFVGLLDVTDDSISNVAVEVVLQLVLQVKSEDLVCYVLDVITQQCLKLCNFSKSVSYFNLAGRMLSSIAPLASQMVESYGSFIDNIYTGLSYPDETIQSSLCFILVHIYSSESLGAIPNSLHARGVEGVMVILGQAQSQELLLNALGLLKKMFAVPGAIHQLVSYSNNGTTLSSVIKKLLLLKKTTLQIAVIQCLCGIVSSDRGQHATGMLLQGDVAEFLFEALPNTNELLLSSLFCCLLLFTESDVFFQKCHAVYGLESILRGIEQAVKLQSHQTTLHGMNLLSNILHKQPSTVRLFSNISVLKQCLGIICQGLQCISHHVFMTSVEAFHSICKKEYLTTHVPYESLLMLLHHLAMVVSQSPQLSTTSTRFHHESVKLRKKIAEKQNGTSTKSEDRLFGLISSIEKVLEVQIDGSILGSSTELMNNGGKDGTLSQQNFSIEVLQICDEVCIPVTMMNLKVVRNDKIFQGLYNSLLHLQSIMGNNRELYLKLVSCGFIEFSLQVKYLHRFVICVLILLALVFLALIILIVAIFLVLAALRDPGDNKIAPSNGPKEQCAYVPPNITNKAGLGRFKFFNALLDCTYPPKTKVKHLKDFVKDLDSADNCEVFYPLKVAAENRLYVIIGCDSVISLEMARGRMDDELVCTVQPIMDYNDFMNHTLGLEIPEDFFYPRDDLKCEPLFGILRTINYPVGASYDDILDSWRTRGRYNIMKTKVTQADPSNVEVFHYVGETKTLVLRVWDSPQQLDKLLFTSNWGIIHDITSGINHEIQALIHLDCLC